MLLLAAILIAGYFWREYRSTGTSAQGELPSTDQSRATAPVEALTKETVVVPYVKKNGRLPAYYITKQEARQKGWNAAGGNLCEVLPGRAIGGDYFSNREKALPVKSGRKWYEADINYHCGHRSADRLLFSNDGLVFVTKDHYKTFEEK
ncbi:ribonuclease [Niabella drilacis]|uniref:Ribonuclease n=1 Tax=Niabella drilacis (strain DSM 25811 / CCM 8410 / CCUG 62505 / LMG 26954 / E90) TaxID=1285928 RepID=A0A1G6SLX6_NIADE|nr:ribonuclease [Niabella drilacis]